ncbi:AAA family ATPase [Balneolaceae bacterium YR4-1]|uniref:AAA family ATPase n=1 Tax=Halalkalibaculum roseum TaxID=2709311 RepID=A0A6M1SZ55_9BACT|nr:AAA family ATPase [Halalkalibaculum roseum]
MSLQELHIGNFKFFRDVDPGSPLLKINGRNLLIYGENGSGKSAIYWALYTLLESSIKKSDAEIEKYFDKRKRESLVNIYAQSGGDAYIEAVIKDEQGSKKNYRVSKNDLDVRGDSDLQESNMASDFINYRVLFQLHNLKHSNENDLFPWFEEEVLPYVKRGSEPCLNEFEDLKNGPDKVTDKHGDEVFPTASLRTSDDPGEKQNYEYYKSYKNRVGAWNDWFKKYLERIFLTANSILQDDFAYNFRITFEIKKKARFNFEASDEEIEFYNPKVFLKVIEYEGIENPKIPKPHTFLNEARWSAIGLAIRFAILDQKLDPAELKCLVIDDMLLSLDMSNRDVVTKLLLERYSKEYQIIFMTHDISYFIWLKHELKNKGLLDDSTWKALEMYVNEGESGNPGSFDEPLLLESESELAIAHRHFSNHDYPAAANYLRKCAEDLLSNWLPEKYWKDKESKSHHNNKMPLSNIIDAGIKFLTRINQPTDLYKELRKYVSILLNPLSHAEVGVNRYKVEIQSIFDLIEDIEAFHDSIEYKPLAAGGETLQMRIPKPSTNQIYTYVFDLKESLYEVNVDGEISLSQCTVSSKECFPIEDGSIIEEERCRFEKYTNEKLIQAYLGICDYDDEFTAEDDYRPFLYKDDEKI